MKPDGGLVHFIKNNGPSDQSYEEFEPYGSMVEIAALFFGAPQLHADLFLCHRLPVMDGGIDQVSVASKDHAVFIHIN
jgi:hypothetical protein